MSEQKILSKKVNQHQEIKKYIIYCIPVIIALSTIIDFSLTMIFSNDRDDIIQNESNPILVFAIQNNIEIFVVFGFSFIVFILTFLVLKSLQNNNYLFYSGVFLILSLAIMRAIVGFSWYFRSETISFVIKIGTFSALIPAFFMAFYTLLMQKQKRRVESI